MIQLVVPAPGAQINSVAMRARSVRCGDKLAVPRRREGESKVGCVKDLMDDSHGASLLTQSSTIHQLRRVAAVAPGKLMYAGTGAPGGKS